MSSPSGPEFNRALHYDLSVLCGLEQHFIELCKPLHHKAVIHEKKKKCIHTHTHNQKISEGLSVMSDSL